jgi:hypothetical protein
MDNSLAQLEKIQNEDLGPKEKLLAVIRLHTWVYGVDPVTGSLIVYNQKSLNPEHWEELRQKQADYTRIVVSILYVMKAHGVMEDMDTTVSVFAMFGMIQWAHLWYDPKGPITSEELENFFIRIFTRGIFTDQKQEVDK